MLLERSFVPILRVGTRAMCERLVPRSHAPRGSVCEHFSDRWIIIPAMPSEKTVDVLFEETNLTVEDIAEATRLPTERIEAIALGRWLPSPNEREKVAEAFGVSINDISWGHTLDPRNIRYRRFGLKEEL